MSVTAQPTLFPQADDDPIRARCWRCRKTTTHRLLTAYANGMLMVSCTECRAGSVLPR